MVIAVGFTDDVRLWALAGAVALAAGYAWLQHLRFTPWWLVLPLAVVLWVLVHESGVHATVAGVALGLLTRVRTDPGEDTSPAEHLEHLVRPLSAGVAVPAFALLAAGVPIDAESLQAAADDPAAVGVVAGLVLGKFVGVFGGTWLTARLTRAELSEELDWGDVAAVALLSGIGFTVSLLIAELAFPAATGSTTSSPPSWPARSCPRCSPQWPCADARRTRRDASHGLSREGCAAGEAPRSTPGRPPTARQRERTMTATSPGPATGPGSTEQTLGALFVNASRDLSALVRSEIELAKAELRAEAKNGAAGAGMFGAAGFLALLAVVLLSIAAAYGLVALGLHPGWAFLIVAVVYLLVGALLVLLGKRTDQQGRSPRADDPHQQGHRDVPQEPALRRVRRCADAAALSRRRTPRSPGSPGRGSTTWSPPTAPGSTSRSAGDGPLVLLLHGFPQFWWAWRHQLPALADRGYRAAAMDLRGFGASDKPPRGYDPRTLAEDVSGVVRSLGERDAVVVGPGPRRHRRVDARGRPSRGRYVAWSPCPCRTRGGCAGRT